MKKPILLISIIAFAVAACQQTPEPEPVDINAEKDAILKVIQNESEYALDGKFEKFKDLYIHDDLNTRLNFRLDSFEIIKGWDNILERMKYLEEREEIGNSITIKKENPIIKVTGNTAWLICDNIWQGVYEGEDIYSNNLQITFLEKVDGEWKISFAAWLQKPETEEEEGEDEEEVAEED
ncbi:MAG: hypothetical protein U9N72_09815 [Bacteroidota bacterium]|nr:hypothetical protein [Bacteroidota bacterium]